MSTAIQTSPFDVLNDVFGYQEFRSNQLEVINRTIQGKDSMVLMPTGGGKSLCYQVPALCLPGVTIVVSPLIALMKDQVDALMISGVKAAFLNSTQENYEQQSITEQLKRNELKLLYVAPERLMGKETQFITFLKTINVSLFAIDEAHCISQWGHDFRPEYLVLGELKKHFPLVPLLCLTATADALTKKDIINKLALKNYLVFENSFNRPNIFYYVKPKDNFYSDLVLYLKEHKEDSGIIYCLSRAGTERLAEDLKTNGFNAAAYHAGLQRNEREERQSGFLRDEIKIMVATIAFGMGINKSNVRFVVHADLPKNIEGYYQETGRAGRDGLHSEALLYYGAGDVRKLKKFASVEGNPEQSRIMLKKLDNMVRFCEMRTCRRKYLLNYFGEDTGNECGSCDICINKPQTHDVTIIAQKILSTVARVKERFGMVYITDILWGSNSGKIRDEHKALKVFGIGKDVAKDLWKYYIRELVNAGYLQYSDDEYPVLKLTEESKAVLYNNEKVFLVKPVEITITRGGDSIEQDNYERALFNLLKQLRTKIAVQENVPAYVIVSDNSLLELATYLPLTAEDLHKMSGFGEYKVAKYGPLFLDCIQNYCTKFNLETKTGLKMGNLRKSTSSKDGLSETKKISYELYKQGKSLADIAMERGLSAETIFNHLSYYISDGKLAIEGFVTAEKQKAIEEVIAQHGRGSLKIVKDNLPEDYTYLEIKSVIAFLKHGERS